MQWSDGNSHMVLVGGGAGSDLESDFRKCSKLRVLPPPEETLSFVYNTEPLRNESPPEKKRQINSGLFLIGAPKSDIAVQCTNMHKSGDHSFK